MTLSLKSLMFDPGEITEPKNDLQRTYLITRRNGEEKSKFKTILSVLLEKSNQCKSVLKRFVLLQSKEYLMSRLQLAA